MMQKALTFHCAECGTEHFYDAKGKGWFTNLPDLNRSVVEDTVPMAGGIVNKLDCCDTEICEGCGNSCVKMTPETNRELCFPCTANLQSPIDRWKEARQ